MNWFVNGSLFIMVLVAIAVVVWFGFRYCEKFPEKCSGGSGAVSMLFIRLKNYGWSNQHR